MSVQFACHRRLSVDATVCNEGAGFCVPERERSPSHAARQPHRHFRNDAKRYIFAIDAALPQAEYLPEQRGS